MSYTLIGLFIAGAMTSAMANAPADSGAAGPASPGGADVHLRVDGGSGRVELLGRTDAAAGSLLQVAVVDGGVDLATSGLAGLREARPVGHVQAGPSGGFAYTVPSAAFSDGASLAVIWIGAGGAVTWAWTRLPLQNPAVPLAQLPSPRSIVVTEFMKNPDAVSDVRGEWFEVFNLSAVPVSLDGWTLRDEGFNNTVLVAPGGGGVVAPGGFLVLGRNGDPALNGGVAVDLVYSGFTLSNGADEIILEAPGGHVIDRVDYGDGPLWPDDSGRSASLAVGAWGTNLALRPGWWCSSVTSMPAGDRGTPGAINDPCGP